MKHARLALNSRDLCFCLFLFFCSMMSWLILASICALAIAAPALDSLRFDEQEGNATSQHSIISDHFLHLSLSTMQCCQISTFQLHPTFMALLLPTLTCSPSWLSFSHLFRWDIALCRLSRSHYPMDRSSRPLPPPCASRHILDTATLRSVHLLFDLSLNSLPSLCSSTFLKVRIEHAPTFSLSICIE